MLVSPSQTIVYVLLVIIFILMLMIIPLYRGMKRQFRTKLEIFSQRAAVAANQQEIDKAIIRERNRISQIIHDDIGNKLIALLYEFDRNFKQESFGIAGTQLLWQLTRELKGSIEDTRTLVRELSSFELDSNGVAGELQKFCAAKDGFYGVTVGFAGLSGAKRFDFEKEKEVIAMAKELVYNSFKYSGCWHIDVALTWEEHRLNIEVGDDGFGLKGRDMELPKTSGLTGMRERCSAIGAQLEIAKSKRGACIRISVPI